MLFVGQPAMFKSVEEIAKDLITLPHLWLSCVYTKTLKAGSKSTLLACHGS